MALLGIGALLGWGMEGHSGWTVLFVEDGPIETFQVMILLGAATLYYMAFLKTGDAKAIFCLLMCVMMLVAVQRELPGCQSRFYEGGICLTGSGKYGFVALVIGSATASLFYRDNRIRPFFELGNLRWAWPVTISVVILVLSEVAEHTIHEGMEEMLELSAYLYALAYAGWTLVYPRTINR